MASKLEKLVAGALTNVRNPRVDNDVISAGMVRDLDVNPAGVVSLTFVLSPDDPASLVRDTRKALKEVDGVTDVRIDVLEPKGSAPSRGAQPASRPAAVPPAAQAAHAHPPAGLPELGRIIAISSGKGGVGKSTVSANLAVQLVKKGNAVGLMDADVYGPNIPRML